MLAPLKGGANLADGRKEYELLVKLQAALGSGFNSSFQAAMNTTKQLQSTLNDVKKAQSDISGYKKQQDALESSRGKLSELQSEYKRLQNEERVMGGVSADLAQRYRVNQQETYKTAFAIKEQEEKLGKLSNELKQAGINTDNLTAENERLKKSYDQIQKNQGDFARITAAQNANKAAIAETQGELLKTTAIIGGIGAAIYAGPVKSATAFESAMADVSKVVDGMRDESTGQLTQEYHQMKQELLDLSTKIPMTAKQLSEIAAAAGQAGIAREEIAAFATDAAKMGIAFDTTADQAGEWMAKWRTSFGMTQAEVVALADKINHLSNEAPGKAKQISEIVMRIGPLGEVAGFASGEIAALGSTLTGIGVKEDVAATSIKNLMLAMVAGSAATKGQKDVLETLGMSATDLAKRMKVDAKGAVLDFMKAIKQLPAAEQAAALQQYFGKESIEGISPLLTKLNLLEESFNKVGDASIYAGSMEKEYAARADTTENKMELAKNSLTRLSIILGDMLLPSIAQAADSVSKLAIPLANLAAANPELIATIAQVAAGLAGLRIASLIAKLGFLELRAGVLNIQKAMLLYRTAGGLAGIATTAWTTIAAVATTVTTALGAAFAFLVSPIGLTILAIAAVIGVVVLCIKYWDEIKAVALSAWEGIKAAWGEAAGWFGQVWEATKAPFIAAWDKIKAAWGEAAEWFGQVWEVMKAPFVAAAQWYYANFIQPVIRVLAPIIQSVGAIFAKIWEIIVALFGVAPNWFNSAVIQPIIAFFTPVVQSIGAVFLEIWESIVTLFGAMPNWFNSTVIQPIIAFFAPMVEAIGGFFTSIWNKAVETWTAITTVFSAVQSWFSEQFAAAWEAIKAIFAPVGEFFSGIWETIKTIFTEIGITVGNAVAGAFRSVVNAILQFAQDRINGFINGINQVVAIVNGIPGVNIAALPPLSIPQFAKGTNYTPDTFIAGEQGAELITNARGRKVFTAAQTGEILNNINYAMTARNPESVTTPTLSVATSPGGGITIKVENNPVIHVDGGNAPNDLEEKLKAAYEYLISLIMERLRQAQENEKRWQYG